MRILHHLESSRVKTLMGESPSVIVDSYTRSLVLLFLTCFRSAVAVRTYGIAFLDGRVAWFMKESSIDSAKITSVRFDALFQDSLRRCETVAAIFTRSCYRLLDTKSNSIDHQESTSDEVQDAFLRCRLTNDNICRTQFCCAQSQATDIARSP